MIHFSESADRQQFDLAPDILQLRPADNPAWDVRVLVEAIARADAMVSVGDHEQDRGFEMISKQKERRESRFSLPDLREVVFEVNIVPASRHGLDRGEFSPLRESSQDAALPKDEHDR